MARIVFGSYVVRFPVGGYLSWTLQWLLGFHRLGHEIYFVEKSGYHSSCFNPTDGTKSDDCSYGTRVLDDCLRCFGLKDRWCYVDSAGCYHGLSRERIEEIFRTADLFIDMGMYEWLEEADHAGLRVLVDGEPGYAQMGMEQNPDAQEMLSHFDYCYTVGRNVGTDQSAAPTAGRQWRPMFDPVVVDLFPERPADRDAPFTTVMSWQAHDTVEYNGKTYGQKDVEFRKFMDLPRRTPAPLELAVGGKHSPSDRIAQRLAAMGWRLRTALSVSMSLGDFVEYIYASRGEFSVCKNVFVATNSGFFSDRSAAYLACGRPVVMQETGFSAHLPCGCGLFAVRSAEEAAEAIDTICGDYERHSRGAREVARECLDAPKVLATFLQELRI